MENPYHPYDLKSGNWPYGDEVIAEIKKWLDKARWGWKLIVQGNPGSGKTSILNRIRKNPDILGRRYIPVYIDSSEYVDRPSSDLYSCLNIDISKSLQSKGYDITKTDSPLEPTSWNAGLELLSEEISNTIGKNDRIIFIFDEFDHLLENTGSQSLSLFFRIIKQFEKYIKRVYILLAVERTTLAIPTSKRVSRFMKSAKNIVIEEVFQEPTIRKWILEPVKKYLEYEESALKNIVELSGKNLYCQQLICYNIFNILGSQQRSLCTLQDVTSAIQLIQKEKQPGFKYSWDNKMTANERILASALGDETILEKRQDRYIFNSHPLLETIFKNELNCEIGKLSQIGYTIETRNQRNFPFSLFKLPLFTKWIRAQHPFLLTVLEQIDRLGQKVHLKDILEAVKNIDSHQIKPFERETILKLGHAWCTLRNAINKDEDAAKVISMKHFLSEISQTMGITTKPKKKATSSIDYFTLDFKSLNIGTLEEAYCFFQPRTQLMEQDIDYIERRATEHAKDRRRNVTIFFYFERAERAERLAQKPYLNIITINESEIRKIIFAIRPHDAFRQIILTKFSLQKISPYQIAGPVIMTFYGRESIIHRITASPEISFAIVGARKIGKSSLLHRIKSYEPPDTDYVFMNLELDFSQVTDYSTFLNSLESEVKKAFGKQICFDGNPNKIKEVIIRFYDEGRRNIVFILDEIDPLIEFDRKHGYKLLTIFRGLAQQGYCQFILAGFKSLHHEKRNIYAPFFNFCEEILLTPLEEEAARDLLLIPMSSIGVQYDNEDDIDQILEYTGRHPNLIQFFCQSLIEKIEKHEKPEHRRIVFKNDIKESMGKEYESYVTDEIYMFFTDLSKLDRVIVLLMAEESSQETFYTISWTKRKLYDIGITMTVSAIHKKMREMVMRFILLDMEDEKYCFALKVFPGILKKRISEDLKNDIIIEAKADMEVD